MVEATTDKDDSNALTTSDTEEGSTSSNSESFVKVKEDERPKIPQKRRRQLLRWLPFFGHHPEDVPDRRFDNKKYESIGSYHIGYPQWAAYQNSDPSFRIYKRYGTLRNRVILYRQQELALLEEELKRLDDEDHKSNNFKTRSLLIDKDETETESKRMILIDRIDSKLQQYDDLLEREKRSGLMEKPSARNYRSLVNYVYNNKPVVEEEVQFLEHRDDFVMLTGQSESPLETILDYIICRIPVRWIRQQFSSEAQAHKLSDAFTILTSPRKVHLLARGVASFLAIALISIPLFVLASENICENTKFIVLLMSLFAFPIAIQVAARPRNLELFVATATYCAVLSTLLATSATFNLSDLQSQLSLSLRLNNSTTPSRT